jgi:hypothetical protein
MHPHPHSHHPAHHDPGGYKDPKIDWSKPQPAALALWHLIHSNFPQVRNDGIYNDRDIAGTHIKSLHAEGRAIDLALRVSVPNEKLIGDQLFWAFREAAKDVGFQELIWNRQIWSTTKAAVHAYAGHDPHTGHIHAGFTRAASQQRILPGKFAVLIAAVRTGIEDLAKPNGNVT